MEIARQSELFPPGALPEGAELLMSEQQQRDLYPLSTVSKNRERLDAAILLLAKSAPKKFICETLHIGWYTLDAIAREHGEKIADIKRRSATKAALFVELGIEQMLEDLQAGKIDPDKLPFAWKMVLDGMQLLSGDSTVIVGQAGGDTGPRITAQSLREKLAKMKRVDAEVLDLPATGSGQGNVFPLSAPSGSDVPKVDNQSTK